MIRQHSFGDVVVSWHCNDSEGTGHDLRKQKKKKKSIYNTYIHISIKMHAKYYMQNYMHYCTAQNTKSIY